MQKERWHNSDGTAFAYRLLGHDIRTPAVVPVDYIAYTGPTMQRLGTTATTPSGEPAVSLALRMGRALSWKSAESPTRLKAAIAATVVLAALLSLGGWYSVDRRANAIDDAAAAAEQLILVQDVRVLAVQADAIASNAYLAVGQETTAQRAEYDDRIAGVATGLVRVSQAATIADAVLLRQSNAHFSTYVGLVEQARANNRQGFPVGAAYQKQAREVSRQLVDDLRQVESNSRAGVDASMERAHRASWALAVAALLLFAALVVGCLWLALRWRRLFNVPLAIATIITLTVLTVGLGVNANAIGTADDVVTGPLSTADLVAQARAAGFDARSNEALTLIARGNGADYQIGWQRASNIVDTALGAACSQFSEGCSAIDAYAQYTGTHEAIRELDEGGNWDAAVQLATTGLSPDAPTGTDDPNVTFDQFAADTGLVIGAQSSLAAIGFSDAVSSLGALRLLVLLAGAAVAILAVIGYGQRIKEYR